MGQNRCVSRGGGVTAKREKTGPKRSTGSTFPWSFYPLNVSFMTELNSREQLILYASLIIACVTILAIFSLGLVLFFYAKPSPSPLACLTPECIEARGYLRRMINTSRDACSDFYGYVYDSWLERRKDGGSFHWDNIAAWLAKTNETLLRNVSWRGHRIAAHRPWATTRSSREQVQREHPVSATAAQPTWSAAPHRRQRRSTASRHVSPGLQLAAGLRGPACELRTKVPDRRVPHAVARGAEDVLHALLSPVL
ncbi:uncharacterized protein LOC142563818 [Dermacentor variabilis]|uniref:uncharacterized protein LOC142563818 n=1 Tax=Dermacentor variabilis TaxID=34621 RepID=UPI003F5B547D